MRALRDCHPLTVFLYFLLVSLPVMFSLNPLLLVTSLAGAVCLCVLREGGKAGRVHLTFALLFVLVSLLNPLVSHNGATVLFLVNDNPITLEALWYGMASGTALVSALYWLRSFSRMMTGDRLLYLFGRFWPKLGLILSMTLRYIPLFGEQVKRVRDAQKGIGLYKEDNTPDNIRGGVRIFSVMVTWALENGIVTADSMTARGYGLGRRTFFSIFRFRRFDGVLTLLCLLLFAGTVAGLAFGALDVSFYPRLSQPPVSGLSLTALLCYGALSALPSILEVEETVKWNSLRSEI